MSLFAAFFPVLDYNKPLIYKFRIASHHRICAKRVQSLCAPPGGGSHRSVAFFLQGALVTNDCPSGCSPDPSVCPTGGDPATVLGGGTLL